LKNPQISSLMKIRQVGTKSFYADGQTVKTQLIVPFHNFANRPNKMGGNFARMEIGLYQNSLPESLQVGGYLEDLSVDGNIA